MPVVEVEFGTEACTQTRIGRVTSEVFEGTPGDMPKPGDLAQEAGTP